MKCIADWVYRLKRLRDWIADPLDIIELLGDTASSCRLAAKAGFALLRANSDKNLEWETWSTEWWLSQTLKKFRGLSEVPPDQRAAQAISGFRDRNLAARSIRLPRLVRARVRELLERALPDPGDEIAGHFGPGAIAERLDSVERWDLLSGFRLNPRTGSWSSPRDAIWHQAPDGIARLCAVPKDVTRDRLITVEPGEHSFWQQALRDSLLKSVHTGPLRGLVMDMIIGGIPEVRQRLRCQRGSANGHTTTLDLEDASDRISYQTVADVFPAWVMYLVDLSRTTSFIAPGRAATPEQLFIYAGMGNASTFMVETLYFWATFTAICERLGQYGLVTAFGDDVIVPSRAASHPSFLTYCEEAGLTLNTTKSVLEDGPGFREACGCACQNGMVLHELISVKGPFDDTDVGRMNLAGLITRLDHSPLWAHNLLARDLFDACELDCVQWDRPLDGIGCILGKHLPPRGNVKMTWDAHYQRWFIRHKACVPQQRRYYCANLSTDRALGVLRGQLKVDTVKRKGSWKSVIKIDLPKRIRLRPRKIFLPW